jgi:TatD DNase family protein
MHPIWIDTHCHLDAPEFAANFPAVIDDALQNNVQAILLPAVRAADCQQVRAMANQYAHPKTQNFRISCIKS